MDLRILFLQRIFLPISCITPRDFRDRQPIYLYTFYRVAYRISKREYTFIFTLTLTHFDYFVIEYNTLGLSRFFSFLKQILESKKKVITHDIMLMSQKIQLECCIYQLQGQKV